MCTFSLLYHILYFTLKQSVLGDFVSNRSESRQTSRQSISHSIVYLSRPLSPPTSKCFQFSHHFIISPIARTCFTRLHAYWENEKLENPLSYDFSIELQTIILFDPDLFVCCSFISLLLLLYLLKYLLIG